MRACMYDGTLRRHALTPAPSSAAAAEPDYRGLATAASSLAVAAKALASAAPRGGDGKFMKVSKYGRALSPLGVGMKEMPG